MNPPPRDVHQIGTVTKYELIKYLRGRRLLAIVLLTVIISAILLIVPPVVGSQYPKDPTQFALHMLGFLGTGSATSASISVPLLSVLSATFFGADAIVSEYESKTGYFLFPNPIRKTAIFLGKFLASALVSAGTIGLFYLIAAASVRVVDGSIPVNMGLSFAYSLVYLFAILAVAYLFSAIMRSSVYSLILTFFTFFLILPIVDAVGSVAKFKPWFSLTFASLISQYIFQNPYPSDTVVNASGVSLAAYYPDVRVSLAVMEAYFIVAFVLALMLARRREM